MNEYAATWRSTMYGILPHPSAPKVLMLPEAAGWSLPHRSFDTVVRVADVGTVNAAMHHALGGDITTLRNARYRENKDAQQIDAVYVLEQHHPAWEPPDGALGWGRRP